MQNLYLGIVADLSSMKYINDYLKGPKFFGLGKYQKTVKNVQDLVGRKPNPYYDLKYSWHQKREVVQKQHDYFLAWELGFC